MNLFKKIMPKDSFYLILFICVGVLGASAVWVSKEKVNPLDQLEAKEEIIEQEIKLDLKEENISKERVKNSKREKIADEKEIETKKNEEKPAEKNEIKEETKVEEKPVEKEKVEPKPSTEESESVASGQVEVKNTKLIRPVEGKIYKDFANDKLVYSKTLEEWSVHLGMDIAAKEGTDVKAALDGIVKTVNKDGKLGITIVLDHGNGLETVYKNVSTEKMIKVGQKVKSGEIISKVSRGVGLEKLDEAHLHFEVLESGVGVDPKKYF